MSTVPPLSSRTGSRLRLAAQPPYGRRARLIDGAWWPRSYDLTAELPELLSGLPRAWGQVARVSVNGAVWGTSPGRMLVADEVVHLHLTHAPRTSQTICLLAPGRGRWDLLVVPPDTSEAEAGRLMESALQD